MTSIRFKSHTVEDEKVGDFPILGKGVGAHPRIGLVPCPKLPDLFINLCDATCLIMFSLMLREIIPTNVLFIVIPFAFAMIGDTLMLGIVYECFYTHWEGDGVDNPPDDIYSWFLYVHAFFYSLRTYLVCKYIYAFNAVLSTTNSLAILTRPSVCAEMVVKLPSFFMPIDAIFIFLLFFFGCYDAFLFQSKGSFQRGCTSCMISFTKIFDSTAWYIYMFICRCAQSTNEIAHFSMLIRNLPILYLVLAIVRCGFCSFYKFRVTFFSYFQMPWKTNGRGIRLLLDTGIFIATIYYVTLYLSSPSINGLNSFIYLAVIERITFSILNFFLIWCYDANDDDGGGPKGEDGGRRFPNPRPVPVVVPPEPRERIVYRDREHYVPRERIVYRDPPIYEPPSCPPPAYDPRSRPILPEDLRDPPRSEPSPAELQKPSLSTKSKDSNIGAIPLESQFPAPMPAPPSPLRKIPVASPTQMPLPGAAKMAAPSREVFIAPEDDGRPLPPNYGDPRHHVAQGPFSSNVVHNMTREELEQFVIEWKAEQWRILQAHIEASAAALLNAPPPPPTSENQAMSQGDSQGGAIEQGANANPDGGPEDPPPEYEEIVQPPGGLV